MLNPKILRKLESIRDLPTVPIVISQILNAIDSPNTTAGQLANLIEKDQSITARVLRIANSPFYGFARKISTVDLAVVVMGMNGIKEIVMSVFLKKLFKRARNNIFDIQVFWHYSVYCGACARLLARKLGYRLAGEAFVAGLMHDIGILIIAEFFKEQYKEILLLQIQKGYNITQAEQIVLGNTHCEIGAWVAEKWNIPDKLVMTINNHHTHYTKFLAEDSVISTESVDFSKIDQPLTAIVSLSEWFAELAGMKQWNSNNVPAQLYLSKEVFDDISEHDILNPDSAFEILKREINDEYEKASILNDLSAI